MKFRSFAVPLLALLGAVLVAPGHAYECQPAGDAAPARAPRVLAPTSAAEPAPPVPGAISIAMLPDVQYYTLCRNPHLQAQLEWIEAEAGQRDIRATLFMGDLTEHNSQEQWAWFRQRIESAANRVPIMLATGNHDYGRNGNTHLRRTMFARFFPKPPGVAASLLADRRRASIANAYYRIALPRVTLGVLVLEWAPRASTVRWANAVLGRHPQDRVIVVTHAYLYNDSTRYDWHARGKEQLWNPLWYDMNWYEQLYDREHDGEMLWNALVRRHPGIFLVLSGHVGGSGTGRLASRGDDGNLVQQVLGNFQLLDEGGLGYLRLFEIQPDGRSMRMKTYSPSLARFAVADDQQATLAIEPALW